MNLRLPYPPSINNYYAQRRNVRCGVCRQMVKVPPNYLSKEAKQYRREVARLCIGLDRFGDAKLAVRVDWFPPADRGDVDNRIKPLLDALEDAKIFDDDKQVKDIRLVWRHPVPGGHCLVKIWRK